MLIYYISYHLEKEPGGMGFTKKKILITDDDRTFLLQMCLLMRKMGLNVIPAEDGTEVLKLVKIQRPDLIMLDIHMSVLDGVKTLKYLLEDRETSGIPVAIVSSDRNSEAVERCRVLGAYAFLQKPVDIRSLHETLQDCLFMGQGFSRKYLRAPYSGEIKIHNQGSGSNYIGETLSERGVYVITPDPMPVGTVVDLAMALEGGDSISMRGNVIYHKGMFGGSFDSPPGMAIEFAGNEKEKQGRLTDFVRGLLTREAVGYGKDSIVFS
jgi:CheY-like chemotaxis protein